MNNIIGADSFERTHNAASALRDFDSLQQDNKAVSLAGRIMAKRGMGNIIFFNIKDDSGAIQCCVNTKTPEALETVKKQCSRGDLIGITGTMFTTERGERSVRVAEVTLLTRAMKDLPEKFHGLTNVELRYRKRYLDLLVNDETMKTFQTRSKIVQAIRNFLSLHNFLEVETPTLQKTPCGAAAKPFSTRHDALELDLYLRISPETFLKQLIVGGMERVFEIGKNFRNEGMDPSHLQEFTMLEFYVAYWNYRRNIGFSQSLIEEVVLKSTGSLQVEYQGTVIDFANWEVVEYRDLVLGDSGIDVLAFDDVEQLKKAIESKGIDLGPLENASLGTVIDKLYKKVSRPKLIQPTILLHHPACLIPLARRNDADPRLTDSFQILVNGWEIVKAYSELADPVLQRSLLEEQAQLKEAGDEEAMFLDEDFLNALEHGMPPVSGLGLGIDRLVALLTNQKSLRDVVLFPTMK